MSFISSLIGSNDCCPLHEVNAKVTGLKNACNNQNHEKYKNLQKVQDKDV